VTLAPGDLLRLAVAKGQPLQRAAVGAATHRSSLLEVPARKATLEPSGEMAASRAGTLPTDSTRR